MLHVGLTGGIGSGKSTVGEHLALLGAVVLDADRIAREVVEPGTPALARISERFGAEVIGPDGTLDRPALGRVVFDDPAALGDLESITHPAIRRRTAELRQAAVERDPAVVVVHDVPLLVEKHMTDAYHLVVVVDAAEEVRLRRLVDARGIPEADARARVRAQATDEERRAAADVLVDNNGTAEQTRRQVETLWGDRIVPYERNVRAGLPSPRPETLVISPPDPTWPTQAARLLARIRRAAESVPAVTVTSHHIGSTSVPGLGAKDVIDLQLGVESLDRADDAGLAAALAAAGFPQVSGVTADRAKPWPEEGAVGRDSHEEALAWHKRFHASSDPGRVAHLHVREVGSSGWLWALLFRDWLRADEAARADYAALKAELESAGLTTTAYTEAKEPWFDGVHTRVEQWARRTGWRPPADTA
jgi:dephospho-CoA kinase